MVEVQVELEQLAAELVAVRRAQTINHNQLACHASGLVSGSMTYVVVTGDLLLNFLHCDVSLTECVVEEIEILLMD